MTGFAAHCPSRCFLRRSLLMGQSAGIFLLEASPGSPVFMRVRGPRPRGVVTVDLPSESVRVILR